jgi:ABC-type Fe3+/spermidine/putrescine transport system ATPase subunit
MDFACSIELEYPGFSLKADFTAASGNLVTLLGPSGCGKTTLLRSAAGLETLSEGSFSLGGREITRLPPERRNVGFVFQDYALFSHLSVYENIAYGPKTRGWGKAQTEKRVFEKLDLVGLRGYGSRRVNELSGGEQQRVALARALAVEPDLLLLDEPLSALDAGTRTELRRKISRIQKELSITTIYVTHDQQEALAISDTIVLMKNGRIVQTGPPAELYYRPTTEFAARFIGTANILPGPLFFRPEHCLLKKPRTGEFYRFSGRLRYREYMGKEYAGELYDEQRKVVVSFYFPAGAPISTGETVDLFVPKTRTSLLSQEAQENLRAADT